MSLPDLLRLIWRIRQDDRINVYFNSTNTYFPGLMTLLRLIAVGGVWCLDMHDDLRYHNKGLKRWRESLIISLMRRLSHVTVHAAPTLRTLFPDSQHLGNASNLLPLSRDQGRNDSVLIVASFDERLDFDFLSDVARSCPALQFHLHGWTRPDDRATQARIVSIEATNPNVHYHGGYAMADLPAILSGFYVSLAPYRAKSPLTRYIDPLRFYHCLNAGLEVVSTEIPQSRAMEGWVHVVPDAAACARALSEILAGRLLKQPGYSPITWEQRADRLAEILRGAERTRSLLRKQSGDQRAVEEGR